MRAACNRRNSFVPSTSQFCNRSVPSAITCPLRQQPLAVTSIDSAVPTPPRRDSSPQVLGTFLKQFASIAAVADMALDVRCSIPFCKQDSPLNCGVTSLWMALEFLGPELGLSVGLLEHELGADMERGVSTLRLAIVAKKMGFSVTFTTLSPTFSMYLLNVR